MTGMILSVCLMAAPQDQLIVCGWDEVFIIPASAPPPAATDRIWRWRAADSPEIPAKLHPQFRTTDECKPVGDSILITSSSNGVALIRRKDKKCLFYASARNAHSACLLPEQRVAVASSFGGDELLIFDQTQSGVDIKPVARMPLIGAHGAVWDAKRERLWTLGDKELLLVELRGKGTATALAVEKRLDLPESGGHDLSVSHDPRYLVISTSDHVHRYDTQENRFAPHPALANQSRVKSVDEHPKTGRIVYHQATEKTWWSDTLRLLNPAVELQLPKERLYKTRWDVAR